MPSKGGLAPTLTTARITLAPLGEADVWTVHALWTDPDVRRHLWDDVVITPERAREVLQAGTRDFRERHYGLWGIHEGPADALAGFVGCRPWLTGEPELVYGLRPAWWHRGFATEASQAVLAYVFETLGHPSAVAATDPPNAASIRVMERLGMTLDWRGEVHGLDTLVYRVSRERWRRLAAV
ncbi:MAG: GNAT family N-acetyltransferase [Vicinamibacterales bacterium]